MSQGRKPDCPGGGQYDKCGSMKARPVAGFTSCLFACFAAAASACATEASDSTGAGPRCYATGRVCSNDTGKVPPPPAAGAKCTVPTAGPSGGGAAPAPGAAIDCMGTRDYRPTLDTLPAATPPRQRGGDRVPSKADALFLENVHGVSFKNVTFEFEAPRRPWFGACLAVDRYTDGVTGADGIKCINGPP